ncbi:MAG: hypothetical protein GF355_06810, partial [Candidatus Eisenbacteria bacterium]|nr:hypothetical protein [Candidatus Eisenbacteria bacterium]
MKITQMNRSSGQALVALLAAALLWTAAAQAGPRICERPPGQSLPANIVAALEQPDGPEPAPYGYQRLLEQV